MKLAPGAHATFMASRLSGPGEGLERHSEEPVACHEHSCSGRQRCVQASPVINTLYKTPDKLCSTQVTRAHSNIDTHSHLRFCRRADTARGRVETQANEPVDPSRARWNEGGAPTVGFSVQALWLSLTSRTIHARSTINTHAIHLFVVSTCRPLRCEGVLLLLLLFYL